MPPRSSVRYPARLVAHLLEESQRVDRLPMMSQWDDLVSNTRASPVPLEASDGDAAGGVHGESPLELLRSKRATNFMDSSLGGLHGDVGRNSGVL